MEHEPSAQTLINERRNFFRIEDTVLLRYQPIDETSALSNLIPHQFKEDLGYSLMHELQLIEQENHKYLRSIAEQNRELEAYLKGISKKIDLIAAKMIEREDHAPDQSKQLISISEGGLSFHSPNEIGHDSYLALQLTLLPSHQTLVLFTKVINCSANQQGYSVALSFVHLKDADRQILAKHIIQLQLAQRRKQVERQDNTLL